MCRCRIHLWTICGHTSIEVRRCEQRPFCQQEVVPRVVTHSFCPTCPNTPPIIPPYTQARREARAARQRDRDNTVQQADTLPAPAPQRDRDDNVQQADFLPAPAPHGPRTPGPHIGHPHAAPDPYVAVLQNYRQRMDELDSGYRLLIQALHTHGASQEVDIELVDSLHRRLVDLNRGYISQLRGFIDVLRQLSDHPDSENASPVNRNAQNSNPQRRPIFPMVFNPPGFEGPDADISESGWHMAGLPYLEPRPLANRQPAPQTRPEIPPRRGFGILVPISLESLSAEERRCGICLQDIGEDGDIYPARLPCLHVFGDQCIERWLASHGTCPMCRRDYNDDLER